MNPRPNLREAGSGPAVVCLHCNASSGAQWASLTSLLAPRHRVLAPDLWGAGQSPRWTGARLRTLDDEVDLVAPALESAGRDAVIVGHSYGAAVALRAAQRMPSRVRALALYEPTLFSLIDQALPAPNDADGIRHAAAEAAQHVARGELEAAARRFIDYWSGPGSWERMPLERRAPVARSMQDVAHWAHALFDDRARAASFASLRVPVLFMRGTASPVSARGVARILAGVLPDLRTRLFPGLGHMGPVEQPAIVNAAIERFIHQLPERRNP